MRTALPLLALLACEPPGTDLAPNPATDAADDGASDTDPRIAAPPNLLIVILDDWGIDKFRPYGATDAPPMPFLESLAGEGLLFERYYTHPVCSPTRTALITGRYPFRSGIYGKLNVLGDRELPLSAVTAAEALAPRGYTAAAIGKWHLGSWNVSQGRHPLLQGFRTHRGPLGNILHGDSADGLPQHYTDWERLVDGVPGRQTTYATTRQVDDAVEVLSTLPEPWFGWFALNAPHEPLHAPPVDLLPAPIREGVSDRIKYAAMLFAVDRELERFFTALPGRDHTWVAIVGDNGTAEQVVGDWYVDRPAKGGLFEGGIRAPFILVGPGLTPGRTASLASDVDLLPTWLGLSGAPPDAWPKDLDGVDLAPLFTDREARPRPIAFSSIAEPESGVRPVFQAAMTQRFKLMRTDAAESLFDLDATWPEGAPLDPDALSPEAAAAKEALSAHIEAVFAKP